MSLFKSSINDSGNDTINQNDNLSDIETSQTKQESEDEQENTFDEEESIHNRNSQCKFFIFI